MEISKPNCRLHLMAVMLAFAVVRSWSAGPFVTTDAAVSVTSQGADMRARVNPWFSPTAAWFEWGTNNSFANLTPLLDLGSNFATFNVTQSITGLLPGTIYQYRVKATNADGTSTGTSLSFQTGWFDDLNVNATGVLWPAAGWGDLDNDGDLDLALTGAASALATLPTTQIFRNEGGTFTNVATTLTHVQQGSVALGDVNRDGFLDLAYAGRKSDLSGLGQILTNNGDGTFKLLANVTGTQDGSLALGDLDNDGDPDLLYTGESSTYLARVYRNDGTSFANLNLTLPGVQESSVAVGDFDGDGLVDLLVAGNTNTSAGINLTRIYHNNGNGTFSNSTVVLPGVRAASVAAGDYDNDGNLDFVLTGTTNTFFTNIVLITLIYHNNGNGTFSNIQAALPGMYQGSVAWGDFDSDGKLDLAMMGLVTNGWVTRIFLNSNGTFSNTLPTGMLDLYRGVIAPGDLDNDGRLDLLLTGVGFGGTYASTKIFRNIYPATNTPPAAPGGLRAVAGPGGTSVTFYWHPASDAQTPASGLNYNLRVGTSHGGGQIISSQSDLVTGWRRLPARGNVPHGCSYTLTNLTPGATYYWGVQAIDTSYAGSPFADEAAFVAVPPPQITIQSQPNGSAVIQGLGLAGFAYHIEATTNLEPHLIQWLPVANPVADGAGHFQFTADPQTAGQQFYRAVYP